MKKHNLFLLLVLLAFGQMAWAQVELGNLPAEVKAEDATITEFGHATMTMEMRIVTDSITRRIDTLREMKNIEWDTPRGTAKRRNAERGLNPNGSGLYEEGGNWWLDIYYYNYNYPSINAEGAPVLLSAMACMPDDDCAYINNVIIGCHVTITSNKECPSSYKRSGSKASDVGMLMNHASSGMVFHSAQKDKAYYNLVIMPDYEGYGITRDHAHPYLYQELTARQVVDGVRYGIALYNSSSTVSDIRHPFRNGWRSICVGYSQGGSVAMATQRFIEQNGLTDELRLAGSVCGDGPYDPIATLMYYVKQYNNGNPMSMPVVLPLILKGMCDSNPYMKNHQVSDYLTQDFLNSGILSWLTAKEKTTDDITSSWVDYYRYNFPIWTEYINESPSTGALTLSLKLNHILNPAGLEFFQQLYNDYKNTYTSTEGVPLPTTRGLMEDLHLALASNNLTKGWVPQHAIFLYHSNDDTVVPEVNRESAGNSFGEWVIKLHASGAIQFDHIGTGTQFFLGTAECAAIRQLSSAPLVQTIDDANSMKDDINTGFHTLDSWDNPPVIQNNVVHGPVILDGVEIDAEYRLMGNSVRLGSGNNACIPQYSAGRVEVPASITYEGVEYPVNEVAAVAFRMCSKITEVELPEGIYHIGNFAFQGCQALSKVTLPSTLGSIGTGAFIDLPNLYIIDTKAPIPPYWVYNDVFAFHTGGISDNNIYSYDKLLLVPEGSVSSYNTSLFTAPSLGWTTPDGWARFTSITQGEDIDAEAYVAYYPYNHSLTFYYDGHRQHRQGMLTYGLTELSTSHPGLPAWYEHRNEVTSIVFSPLFQYARPTSTSKWFSDFGNVTSIQGLEYLVTDEVTDMSYMFRHCAFLTDDEFNLNRFNTSSVTTMVSMFEGCTGLVQPDFSHFDTRSCTSMENMFEDCAGLTSIDLSMFETTACSFSYMFRNCTNLETISIGSFGVPDNYICREMFRNCSNLTTLVIPTAFNRLDYMFNGCTRIREVYCYEPEPFGDWIGRDTDFVHIPNKYTRFHVLASTLQAWLAAYGDDTEVPANVTFVGDLGTETNPILLYSTIDWLNLSQMVENGIVVNAKMMNDINVTTMMGSMAHPFRGTFDGNGHTLTVNYEISDVYDQESLNAPIPAPFGFIQNAEIKNLNVAGNITINEERLGAGGLVGFCLRVSNTEASSNTITNCHVSTNVSGKVTDFGGIIGGVDNHVTTIISGCLFDGSLVADHGFYLEHTIQAGAMVCTLIDQANLSISHCVENGANYENISGGELYFCPGNITPVNSYFFTSGLGGHAKRAYSLTTDTEGLILDFGNPTANYDVSGITAYNTGLKIDGTFHASSSETVPVAITAPGYEYNISNLEITGGATVTTSDHVHFNVTFALADVVINLPGMVFTTILLYDEAIDNTLRLENYIDQTYDVQLVGHTISKSSQWNTLCLPFDLPSLNGTPLEGAMLRELDTITFENKVAVFHFKYVTSISADKLYFVKVRNNIESPIFNNVTIKRSLPPGIKMEVGEQTQSGFVAEGNYNAISIVDLDGNENLYTAFYFDRSDLRIITITTHLSAFQGYFEICLGLDEVTAIVLDIEDSNNFFTILDDSFTDIDDIFITDGYWNEDANWASGYVPEGNNRKVLIEGSAVIPDNYTAEVGEIIVDEGSILIDDGGQLKHSNYNVNAIVETNIEAYDEDENGGYHLIANPLVDEQEPSYISLTANEYDLYSFDQSEPLEWRNYKHHSFSMQNGIGYLYAIPHSQRFYYFGRLNPAVNDIAVDVVYDENAFVPGFNLIGNPFVCDAYLADGRNFYVLNEDGDEIVTATSNVIAPMQGLFVQTTADENTVSFTTTEPMQSKALTISLMHNHDASTGSGNASATIDYARIRFDGGRSLEKLQLNPNHSKVYISQEGKDYAVVNVGRDAASHVSTMPINFKVMEDGVYTVLVNSENVEMNYLHLIDNVTGADIDLLFTQNVINSVECRAFAGEDPQSLTPSYTFTAKTTDQTSRFKLVFSVNGNSESK